MRGDRRGRDNRPVPVSAACPECGSTRFRKVRSRNWITFADDRVCTDCDTRYCPPTPRWAGLLFLLIGVILFAAGALGIVAGLLTLGRGRPDPVGMVASVGALLVGCASGVHGLRALLFAGSV
jgi:hypothetical protein